MYIGDSDDEAYFLERQKRKKKWKRQRRLKKFCALMILLLTITLIGLVLFFVVKGIITSVKTEKKYNTSEYIEESNSLKLTLVENVYSDEELKALKGDAEEDIEASNTAENKDNASAYEGNAYSDRKAGLIVIDAGHGGKDSGTYNDLSEEKNINLEIAYWLKEELETRGYSIFMTRKDDTFVGLQERANLANEQEGALAMVSIHQNAVEDYEEAAGVEAWTYERSGCIELADCLVKNVSAATGANNRGVSYRTNLVVTSKTIIPSVIVECGYMTNPEEAQKLVSEDYQVSLARGIADALDEFIDLYY